MLLHLRPIPYGAHLQEEAEVSDALLPKAVTLCDGALEVDAESAKTEPARISTQEGINSKANTLNI